MYHIRFILHRLLLCAFITAAIAIHLHAQGAAPALYHTATGDTAGKCLYVIFTFSEQSCFSCLAEISAAWCPAVNNLNNRAKVGMLLLFNSPRLEVAERMRERLRDAKCGAPFVVDTNGTLSAMLFKSEVAGQVLMADADGEVLVHRNVGEDDPFSRRMQFEYGHGGLMVYMDSLTRGCTPSSRVTGMQNGSLTVHSRPRVAPPSLRVLDSVVLEGADTVEMPFAFIYSPSDRLYAYLGGMTHALYLHDSSGRRRSMVRLSRRVSPVAIALQRGIIYAVGGESDTIPISGKGDSAGIPDEIITLVRSDTSGRILARNRINPTSPLSIANDVSLSARKLYLTTQRTATLSYVYNRGIDYDQYLKELYDPRLYAVYIDTMTVIREYDSAMRLLRTYGNLPRELARYGSSRTHFWLEFQRWVKELPDGDAAFLHCASPMLQIYRDGVLARTIDLRGEYYTPITGSESDGKIPRYAGMVVGENGDLYCEYTDPIQQRFYVVAVDAKSGRRGAVTEIGWNDRLLRVDAGGKMHLLRKGRHLQLLVCAPATR